MKKLFSSQPVWFDGIVLVRIMIGIYMMKYGWQIFDAKAQEGMAQWLANEHHFPAPLLMTYLAKGAEFFGGLFLVLGLCTRLACFLLAFTLAVATFVTNGGKIFEGAETSYLYMLFAILFLFIGPGKYSLDNLLRKNK